MTGWIDPQEHRVDRRSGEDVTTPLPAPVTVGGVQITDAVTSVTWTARPGTGIGPDGSAEFTISAGPVPRRSTLCSSRQHRTTTTAPSSAGTNRPPRVAGKPCTQCWP